MDGATQPILADQFAAALAWWRDAGVDCDYRDEPVQWLAGKAAEQPGDDARAASPASPPPVAARPAPPPPPEPIGGPREAWPKTLAEFANWWLSEPSLDGATVRDRVPPRGKAGAALMVVVPQPEAGDGETLLSGAEGKLLDRFLAAAGIADSEVYRAAVLPRHTPLPDWQGLATAGLGQVLAHHIGLVAPQRLIAFGGSILPLFGNAPTQSAKVSFLFNHENYSVPVLGAYELGALLARPRAKAGFWQHWLDWTGNQDA